MEDVRKLLAMGSNAAQRACIADERGDRAEAGALYSQAARCMFRALALEPHFNKARELQDTALAYARRAEKLGYGQAPKTLPLDQAEQSSAQQAQQASAQDAAAEAAAQADAIAQKVERSGDAHLANAREYHVEAKFFQAEKAYIQAAETYLKARSATNNAELRKRIEEKADKALRGAEKLKHRHSASGELGHAAPASAAKPRPATVSQPKPKPKPSPPPSIDIGPSGEGLTDYEKEILKHTSNVNGVMYWPWSDEDATHNITNGLAKFKDPQGLLRLAPKQKALAKWKRPSSFCERPVVVHKIKSRNIKQTVVSDCSFVSSLAISADYENRHGQRLITKGIFPQDASGNPVYNQYGKYVVKLHFNGCWRRVVIDDFLPVSSASGELLCSYSADKNELWVSILEKAYMKVMGGYDFPGSNSSVDLHALTGWIPDRLPLKKCNDVEWKRLWEGLHSGQVLMTMATGNMSEADAERAGLVASHAYAVLDMRDVRGLRLVKLKNPWRHLRWKGRFSPHDTKSWTPALRKALQYDVEHAQENDDGEFWMDWQSVAHFFELIYMNWNPQRFPFVSTFHHCWNQQHGPSKDLYNMQYNPQFKLTVKTAHEAEVWVLLSRHITQIDDFADNKEFITLHVYRGMDRVFYPESAYKQGIKINSPHYLTKLRVPPGEQHYAIVVSQYEKTSTIRFSLKVYSTVDFDLKRMPHRYSNEVKTSDKWTRETAGGCQNDPQSYARNPMFAFTTPASTPPKSDTTPILIKLEAPRVYSVALALFDAEKKPITESDGYRPGFSKMEMGLQPSTTYHVVPATFRPGQEGPFFLTIGGTENIHPRRVR
ncbi:hypothetical protein PTSG_02007 [Salpingoeca rosetta]|uniref:Calpain catalytic domain-containing protein n=1 Tax=Salpingoeca rosetta (strain ATCC 50818 / BSB-021) TaxID=946362 RepID=F2TZL5_SALR5|nr:uncharacterized protein PTSG_02007 [Salpingoeca rosetta]EGD79039.1 hypothetical protein PTSG_02007 [Salpingoeca rosetta]|eukprot:XP_004997995.1 hypothetical protein PTSG_02007 [Salpingoeca rosetta]